MTELDREQTPLVSVIIPTYNRVKTLPAAIESVLGQTYGNVEVIVVDDGSDDGTEEYVNALTDHRIKYIRNAVNRGPAAARNLGVRQAQGKYVAFQDSDDEWHTDKLEKQMPLLLDTVRGYDLVYCEFTRYYGEERHDLIPSKNIPLSCKQGKMLAVLLLQPMISTQTIVVKRDVFLQVGGFDEHLKTFEDYEFTLRFSRDHHIGFVEESLVKVNDSPDSVDKRFADRIRTQAYVVREMIEPLREYGILWDKLTAVQQSAERLKCHDVFLEELRDLSDLFVTEQEREKAAALAEKTEKSDAKQNQYKEIAYETLMKTKQQILETYVSVYGNSSSAGSTIDKTLQQVRDSVRDCLTLFDTLPEARETDSRMDGLQDPGDRLEQLFLLTDLVKLIEELEKSICGQIVACGICHQRFFRNRSCRCPFCDSAYVD